ncbi:TPA: helix-turn-helix domain-containing protein [Campylobacter jejuni]|nr:helix-turn-helix domain-containing protein [Campylobacter jejuni]
MGRNKNTYTYDLKKQAVEMYFEGHSVPDLVDEFEIQNRRTLYEWINSVKTEGYQALYDHRGRKSQGKKKKEGQTLEEKYEHLQLENEYLKKLLDLKRG